MTVIWYKNDASRSVNDDPGNVIDDSRVTLKIVATLLLSYVYRKALVRMKENFYSIDKSN
jgi:hypothetical protein